MTPAPTTFDATTCAELLKRSLAVCATLTERLLDLPETSRRNPAADYNLLGRGMRQGILLLERLANVAADPALRRTAARAQIIRAVEDATRVHAKTRDPDAIRLELLERLEGLDMEIGRRPTPDLIVELCRDLHLIPPFDQHQYRRRTPADIAFLQALAAAPLGQPPPQTPTCQPETPQAQNLPRSPFAALARPPLQPPPQPPLRPPLSTPSLILPPGAEHTPNTTLRPEAYRRDHR